MFSKDVPESWIKIEALGLTSPQVLGGHGWADVKAVLAERGMSSSSEPRQLVGVGVSPIHPNRSQCRMGGL
ncbi:hypothetical protein EMIT0P176_20256 [Pseudomonas sp. IT-P176]